MSQDNNEDFSYNMDKITEDNAPVILDVDGRISLKVPDEDEVPASGIILNKEHMAERNKILPHSIPDERFPDTTLFQYINDDEKYSNKGIDELIDWMNGFEYLPDEFELYDEILNLEGTYLTMHIRVEYGEVMELYLTIDPENSEPGELRETAEIKEIENIENTENIKELVEPEETYDADGFQMDIEMRTSFSDVLDTTKALYKAYIESQDRTNCSMIPTSFLTAYISKYPLSDWKSTVLDAAEDVNEDFMFPIHVQHR